MVAAATKAVQSLESKDTTKSVRARIREEELRAAEEKARKAAEESKRAADEAAAAGLPTISIQFSFFGTRQKGLHKQLPSDTVTLLGVAC